MGPIETIQWLNDQPWFEAVTSAVSTAALIAAITPNKYDNEAVQWLRWILDQIALNVGNAENKKK